MSAPPARPAFIILSALCRFSGVLFGCAFCFAHFIFDVIVFFDVGASLGYYTILAARRCREVHAFEPRRALARHIRRSVELNRCEDRVRVTEAAVADRGGTTELYLPGITQNNRDGSFRTSNLLQTIDEARWRDA